jgi:hypothetical protein
MLLLETVKQYYIKLNLLFKVIFSLMDIIFKNDFFNMFSDNFEKEKK